MYNKLSRNLHSTVQLFKKKKKKESETTLQDWTPQRLAAKDTHPEMVKISSIKLNSPRKIHVLLKKSFQNLVVLVGLCTSQKYLYNSHMHTHLLVSPKFAFISKFLKVKHCSKWLKTSLMREWAHITAYFLRSWTLRLWAQPWGSKAEACTHAHTCTRTQT